MKASGTRSAKLAWGLLALATASGILGLGLFFSIPAGRLPHNPAFWSDVLIAICMLAYAGVGALIAASQPKNAIGWILIIMGLSAEIRTLFGGYVFFGLLETPGRLPLIPYVMWFYTNIWPLSMIPIPWFFLLFPNGRPPSRLWWLVVCLPLIYLPIQFTAEIIRPGVLNPLFPSITNPFGIPGQAARASDLIDFGSTFWFWAIILSPISLLFRYWKATKIVRLQIKWVLYASVIMMTAVVGLYFIQTTPGLAPPYSTNPAEVYYGVPFAVALAFLPISAGIAILRYHLYEIDRIINRTLVYGALTVLVIGLYVSVVGGLSLVIEGQHNLILALAGTGLVAVLFQPLRERLQKAVNHMMYGERDDPYQVLSQLGQRLENSLAYDAVMPGIVTSVQEALKLPYVAITLKQGDEYRLAAESGVYRADLLIFPLVYQSETVGQLLLAPRNPDESFDASEMRLLHDLARQTGVAVHAVRLTYELQRSREQLVLAREEERRRLRRDLHDGLGPQLAGLALKLETARNRLGRDPLADQLLSDLAGHMQEAVMDIRRLVYNLRPPALDELGLIQALQESAAQASTETFKAHVEAPESLPALPAAVEVAVYRIAQEALTNVVRHAQASQCVIRFSLDEPVRRLYLEVSDNGRGIVGGMNGSHRSGVGLISMRERAEELGGACQIDTLPDGGTRLFARLPLQARPE